MASARNENRINGAFALSRSAQLMGIAAVMVLAGCQSTEQILDASQPMAIQTAETRARFDMNCPDATGTVLSREQIQPAYYQGVQRPEYTVGVSGCGRRETLIVVCPPEGGGCIAGEGRQQ